MENNITQILDAIGHLDQQAEWIIEELKKQRLDKDFLVEILKYFKEKK